MDSRGVINEQYSFKTSHLGKLKNVSIDDRPHPYYHSAKDHTD